MELNKIETQAVVVAAQSEEIQELNDLQLVLVGGGIGETIL